MLRCSAMFLLLIHVKHCGMIVADVSLVAQAYDQHLNMILGDVEEIVTTVEIDDETYEEIVRVSFLTFCSLFMITL
jgi:hypothetical protein